MGCNSNLVLANIDFACEDIASGGLKRLLITKLEDVDATVVANALTAVVIPLTKTAEIEFNNKDGVSAFTDEKKVEANGTVSVVPTVTIELPRMTAAKRLALDNLAVGGLNLVAWIETAAGTRHCMGLDFGCYMSAVSGKSGAAKTEKNGYTLVLTGDENHLAYDADAVWATVLASLVDAE